MAELAVLVSWEIIEGSQDFLHTFSMALYCKWDVKNDLAYVLQFSPLISDGLGVVCYNNLLILSALFSCPSHNKCNSINKGLIDSYVRQKGEKIFWNHISYLSKPLWFSEIFFYFFCCNKYKKFKKYILSFEIMSTFRLFKCYLEKNFGPLCLVDRLTRPPFQSLKHF